jgi:hypothetical protein
MPDSVPTANIQPVIGAIAFELSPIRHWGKKEIPLLQRSVPVYSRAEAIITQAPSTLYICEAHDPPFCREFYSPPILWLC